MSDQANMVKREAEPLALDWHLSSGPQTGRDLYSLARVIAGSNMFPHLGGPAAVFTTLRMAAPWGVDPMVALRGVHVIEGRVTMSAGLIEAVVRKSGLARVWRCAESSAEQATYETIREGEEHPVRVSYSMADARRAGLAGKQVWQKYPRQMLRARAASELARMVYPDLLAGAYMPDEIEPETRAAPERAMPVYVVSSSPVANEEPAPPPAEPETAPEPPSDDEEPLPASEPPASGPHEPADEPPAGDTMAAAVAAINAATTAEERRAGYLRAIACATGVADLDDIGATLRGLPEDERAALRGPFAARRAELVRAAA